MQGFVTGILGRDRIPTTQSLRRRRAQCCLPNSVPGRADLSSIALAKEEACEGGLANGTHCRSSALYPGAWKLALTDEQRRQGAAI
jgi:hypothetical protein